MKKSSFVIIVYVLGIIFGALFLGFWDGKRDYNALFGMMWTVIFLIVLFYTEKKDFE